jgi:hypothetical protein
MPAIPLLPPSGDSLDPNLFVLRWDVAFEVLGALVLLSFILERALAVLFESRLFVGLERRRNATRQGTYKPLIAFAVAALACILWKFDAVSIILTREKISILGCLITGAVLAGGSKASVKLFHDVLGVYSSSVRKAREETGADREAAASTTSATSHGART